MLKLPVKLDGLVCLNCKSLGTLRLMLEVEQLERYEGPEESDRPPVLLGSLFQDTNGKAVTHPWLPVMGRCTAKGCGALHKAALALEEGRVVGLKPNSLVKYDPQLERQPKVKFLHGPPTIPVPPDLRNFL